MTRWRGTNCWNAWWTQIVFARQRRPQWGWHLYVAESAVLYLKYFIPCCQCPRLALARGRRRGASDFATFVGKCETRRKNAVVGRRFQCLHRTCWRPWLHWFSRTMRNGEQKPARNPGEDARPLLGDLPAQHPEAATAARSTGPWLGLSLWTFLFGFSSLDFVILDSGAVDLGQQWRLAAAKRSEEKKMSKWFGMISLWPLDSTTVVFIACYAVLCERRRKNMYAYQWQGDAPTWTKINNLRNFMPQFEDAGVITIAFPSKTLKTFVERCWIKWFCFDDPHYIPTSHPFVPHAQGKEHSCKWRWAKTAEFSNPKTTQTWSQNVENHTYKTKFGSVFMLEVLAELGF